MFVENFNNIVQFYDTIITEIGDFLITAEIIPDMVTTPYQDFDVFEITRWENLEWEFCGLQLNLKLRGTIFEKTSLLTGIEMNIGENNHHLKEFADDLLV